MYTMLERYVRLEDCINEISTDFGKDFEKYLLSADESKTVRDIMQCLHPFQVRPSVLSPRLNDHDLFCIEH